jgi:hypothetical protein
MTEQDQLALYNDVVVPLIAESGKPITLIKPGTSNYNPDTGYDPGIPIIDEGVGLELEISEEEVPSSIAGKVVKVLMCVEIAKPEPHEDNIEIESVNYKVLKVEPLKPGNVLFYYTVYLGR